MHSAVCDRKHFEGSADFENQRGFGKSMSANRFQRMLDIPGVLPLDVPVEKTRMLLFLERIKSQAKTSFQDIDFNINSIT